MATFGGKESRSPPGTRKPARRGCARSVGPAYLTLTIEPASGQDLHHLEAQADEPRLDLHQRRQLQRVTDVLERPTTPHWQDVLAHRDRRRRTRSPPAAQQAASRCTGSRSRSPYALRTVHPPSRPSSPNAARRVALGQAALRQTGALGCHRGDPLRIPLDCSGDKALQRTDESRQ